MKLGDWVRIKAASDIKGLIVEHTSYLDGSERWCVNYWHNGERKFVNCSATELEVVPE